MKLQVIVLPRAECDQAEIFEYLARQSLAVAQRFVERVKDTLAGLSTHSLPGMPLVSANARLAELRWAKVRDFPNHLIFFRVSGDLIEVARVLHGARDIESILGG